MARFDRRGRRIGHNWWREYNMAIFRETETARFERRETSLCYNLTDEEFVSQYPCLPLKQILIQNRGLGASWHSTV